MQRMYKNRKFKNIFPTVLLKRGTSLQLLYKSMQVLQKHSDTYHPADDLKYYALLQAGKNPGHQVA